MFRIGKFKIDPAVFEALPESLAREANILPIGFRVGQLRVVAGRRPAAQLRADLERVTFIIRMKLRVMLADADDVRRMLDELKEAHAKAQSRKEET